FLRRPWRRRRQRGKGKPEWALPIGATFRFSMERVELRINATRLVRRRPLLCGNEVEEVKREDHSRSFSLDSITIPSMCGRAYKTYTEEELYFQYLSKRPLKLIDFTPIYNLCPTQNTLVLRLVHGERQFEEM